MSRFLSAGHPGIWAGPSPGPHGSAGKRTPGRTRPGNRWLRMGFVEATSMAERVSHSSFAAGYRRIARSDGHKTAVVAVADIAGAQWVVVNLHPAGAAESRAYAVAGGCRSASLSLTTRYEQVSGVGQRCPGQTWRQAG